ncbi:ABC transporter permease [Chloroflexota bacterium]
MKFIQFFSVAIRALFANKLRSSLTMLGMIIGVGAVIALMSLGRGAESMITSTFEELGQNVIYVQPRNPDAPGMAGLAPGYAMPTLTLNDAEDISDIPSVIAVAPTNENFVELNFGDEAEISVIHGSTPEYLGVYNYTVASGQFFTDRNIARRDTMVVLGSKITETVFGDTDPVGQTVKIKGKRFTVIGVFEPKGGAFMGFSLDDVVVTPITTFQTRLFSQRTATGEDAVQSIAVQASSSEEIDWVTEEVETLLRKSHRIDQDKKDDFAVVSQEQMLGIFEQITGILTLLLGAIASISLVVGSIGIMNIMLVSVTERTREIGIRKAIGAKRRDILVQFLLEAAMLSLVGGGIGIIGGWSVSKAVSLIDLGGMTLNAVVSPDIVILAISVSGIIGLASGIYPAMRAARLDPIEALHYG